MKLEKYTQISTKNGDKGFSKNYSNESYRKDDLLFQTVGTIDELSSNLGLCYHYTEFKDVIKTIQRVLQTINSLVATTNEDTLYKLPQVTKEDIEVIESKEQELLNTRTIERFFVLPGSEGSLGSAYLHVARTIARRAERTLVSFVKENSLSHLDSSLAYLNRVSDLLFIMSIE